VVADFDGGLIGWDEVSITKFDGMAGQGQVLYTGDGTAAVVGVAAHPDGTVFAVENGWPQGVVVGIDGGTGAEKFRVSLGDYNQQYGLIIAGDGNGYVAYEYEEPAGGFQVRRHLMLLRVTSSGAFERIPIEEWTSEYQEFFSMPVWLITKADEGVVVSWRADTGAERFYGLAGVTGGAVSVVNAPAVAGQETVIVPVVQGEDGGYVGSVETWNEETGSQYQMVAFDGSGNLRWSVAGDEPQMALEGGGVIGKPGIVYDASPAKAND
jgi:hypothetical protein